MSNVYRIDPRRDPHFPNLPFVSDEEWAGWTEQQKWQRHLLEVAEASRIFRAMQDDGMDPFEAAERVAREHVPRMNLNGSRQSGLRKLYQGGN
jgi:hypothetical protein